MLVLPEVPATNDIRKEDMMNETQVTIRGNLGSDPALYESSGKRPYVRMTVANTPRRREQATDTWVDGTTTWYVVKLTGNLARNAAASLRRGDSVLLRGTLTHEQWEHEGKERSELVVWGDAVGPDLNNAIAQRMKLHREERVAEAGTGTAGPSSDEHQGPVDVSDWHEVDGQGHPLASEADSEQQEEGTSDPADTSSIATRLAAGA